MNGTAILSRSVDVAHLSEGAIEIEADAADRAKLTAAYDLVAVNSLSATIELAAGPRGSVEVRGRVLAEIVQTCVVSLVPVATHIDEPFSLRFVRPADAPPPKPGAELVIDPERPDPPEVLDGPTIDLGAIVEEAFVLGIDPYPRAPGASLPPEVTDLPESPSDSPFAVLARLRGRVKGGG